jgi:hypothetical protein
MIEAWEMMISENRVRSSLEVDVREAGAGARFF